MGSLLAGLAMLCVQAEIGGSPSDRSGLVVVAPERWRAPLAGFMEAKSATRKAEFLALEDALRAEGVDDPARLKQALHSAWKERAIGYVLLVGDADVCPVRYMVLDRVTPEAFDYAFYPSDLYYADVAREDGTFESWNAASEGFHGGYFGEVRGEKNKSDPINYDGIDYLPELAVGRWPVSTDEELSTLIAKTLAHAAAEPSPRAAFAVVDGWIDARPFFDARASELGSGWRVDKLFYGSDSPPSEAALVERMNAGLGLLVHAGHGADHEWAGVFSSASLAKLTNGAHLPIVFSVGCGTARFATLPPYEAYVDVDGQTHAGTNGGEVFGAPPPPPAPYQTGAFNPTGLGEQFLRASASGAVAYIGCNTGSQPCALSLAEGFVRSIGEGAPTIGDAWRDALAFYVEREGLRKLVPNDDWYPASIYFQGMKFMLFGDPTLRIP